MQREKGKESLRKAVERLDKRLWHKLEVVWQLAEQGIQEAQKSKDGHQQGHTHCLAVEEHLSALIPDSWKGTRFTVTDLFVLSAAAALHDTGKVGDSPEDHGQISMLELRRRPETFGLDRGQAIAVGWIVRAHKDGNLDALPTEPVSIGVTDVTVRPLAALFKLADALHTYYLRVSRQVVEFGDKHAEDNPKTHFRLLITGWHFDVQGRVVLDAAPENLDDETVIDTGFEKTRQELEPVIPTLHDADLPWELALLLDETEVEDKAKSEDEAEQRIERAFVGMDHFIETDAPHFKGRDDETRALWRSIMNKPLTLLMGDSGVGKTSLIYAGLFPLLHRAHWHTIYTRPFNKPDHFIVHDLWRELMKDKPSAGATIVDTLARACKEVGDRRLLVVLDRFEDVVRVRPETLEGLWRALVAVQAERFRNLRLLVSYRTDAEAMLGPLFQQVAGSDRGLPHLYLQPLSRAGAQAALEAGFDEAQVKVDSSLLDVITDELDSQTPMPGVYPPYVQMVGEVLCRAAREENNRGLTEGLYHAKGGCEKIIGHYLLQRLAEFDERKDAARKVLVALVRSTGVTGQQSLEELLKETKLSTDTLMPLLTELMNKRMIRSLSGGQYEIIHGHLALLVTQEIVIASEHQRKELRELLDLKAKAYVTYHTPLRPEEMARLYVAREWISPHDEQLRLLLHSCILQQGPAWFWFKDVSGDRLLLLLRDALAHPISQLRSGIALIIAQLAKPEAVPGLLEEMLKAQDWNVRQAAVRALARLAERKDIPDLRELLKDQDQAVRQAAAQALARILQHMEHEAIPDLRRMLKNQDPNVRQVAVQALAQVAGREAISDLHKMLEDQDKSVRRLAVGALAQILQQMGREAIPDLRKMLEDQEENVRRLAAGALAQILQQIGREAISDLRKMLEDKDWNVRQSAAGALARILQQIGQEAVPDLRKMLKDQGWEARQAATLALAQVVGREAIFNLREMLRDQDQNVRQAATQALAEVAGRDAISDLREMLRDQDQNVRRAAARALAEVAGRDAISDLREMLKDTDWNVRQTAVRLLARILQQIGQEAIPDLREMLEDQDWDIKQEAVQALAQVLRQIGHEAIPNLREMLKDQTKIVRQMAVQVLAQMAWREAIPDLRRMLKDQDQDVWQAAAEALMQVAGSEAISDLKEKLKDQNQNVRQAAAEVLRKFMTESDLTWLAEWVAHQPLAEMGEGVNRLLIQLDRKLYSPFSILDEH